MGLTVQVIWQLMNLFIIAVAIFVPGSSGFSEPLLLESSSPIPSIGAQVPNSIIDRGSLQNGSTIQPPIISPSIKTPPVDQINQGFQSPRQSTILSPQQNSATPTARSAAQTPHGLSSVEPPKYSVFTAAKAPQDSTSPPVDGLPNDLAPSLPAAEPPHYLTAPPSAEPSYNSTLTPSVEPPHASNISPSAKPPVAMPQVPTAEPPEALPLSSPSPPPEFSQHTSTMAPAISTPSTVVDPPDALPLPQGAEAPHNSALPLAAVPPDPKSPLPVAEPPHASAVPPALKWPVTQLPTAESPKALPLASSSPPSEFPQHASNMQSPPIPASAAPVTSTTPIVLAPSHASPQPPVATPSHKSAVPLVTKPPDVNPPLTITEPPHASVPPPVKLPVPQLPTAEPPEALPKASPSLPPEISQPTSTLQSPPIPPIPVVETPTSPTVLAPLHASPQLSPVAKPPHGSALPLVAKPPEPKSPLPEEPKHASPQPPMAVPQLPTAEPPESLPLAPPSPPPKVSQQTPTMQSPPSPAAMAPVNSTPPPSNAEPPESLPLAPPSRPPKVSQQTPTMQSPPTPAAMAPVNSTPPPSNASSQQVSKPPHSSNIPLAANPPDLEPPLPLAEPPRGLNLTPPIESSPNLPLPPTAMPPNPSDMQPPPVSLNASSPLPQPVPPYRSSSPPQAVPPYTMSPPPQLISPDAPPPISVVPSNASFVPPLVAPPFPEPPTSLPSPSPPLPPNNLSPPPQLVPPILSAPPPQLIPPIVPSSPPQFIPPTVSSPLTQMIPPIVPSPPTQLTPPPASPPNSVLPSNASIPQPFTRPPPNLPLPPPAAPPHASAMLPPPFPSHTLSPLPQPVPPHSSSPPYVLSAPPPLELPNTSPPRSSFVHKAIPPHASPPTPFLAPPLTSASPAIPSHTLSAPPPEPSQSSAPPTPRRPQTIPAAPPHSSQRKETQNGAPPTSLTSPERSPSSKILPEGAPPAHQVTPSSLPPSSHQTEAPKHAPFSRLNASEPSTSPVSAPPPSSSPIRGRSSSMAPPGRAPNQSPGDKLSPYHAPSEPKNKRHNVTAPSPLSFSGHPASNGSHHSLRHSPGKGSATDMAPIPSPAEILELTPAPSPLPRPPPDHSETPFLSPKISPSGSSTRKTKRPLAPPIRSLPPPPPNADCAYLTCPEPFTNTPPGSPCGCVWPMQVGLRLSLPLYTFFPLVSELASEVAGGVFMKQSQVRVMGANAASQESDKTIVLVDLVPLDQKFDNITAFMTFQRFWHKQVVIDKSIFGDYDVLYVRYPGLPASPPMAPSDIAVINGMPYSVQDPNQSKVHPLGVDVTKQRHKHRLSGIVIAAIVFSAVVCVLICCSVAWVLVFRHTNPDPQPAQISRALPSLARLSGPTGNSTGSGPSSSMSVVSSLATYTGSAKTFSLSEIEKATDNFNPSRIVGEGGFGLVYSGVLEDETSVAVKVLKRDDHQGGREFLAEVEMLSRLHHRNLVTLIGICTDERSRCLVYELIPNGSVESHLHGTDKDIAPLDWASRMKIALGAARGLAYLHEDSSPRVIHRDFKASNILLENDFTPKVSDFGLARSAMDEGNQHISTRVMGTFGYVAPEYAMTGHLLVKSDVYSYGVVLLELLTGRKPVDMSQPPGQENLASWTRPFLTTKEGLELILDPSLGPDVSLDSAAKVAAIASMCVQPEVSHRPFMGEVVQALKLVCDECDDSRDGNSRHGSHENLSVDIDDKARPVSQARDFLPTQFSLQNYHSASDVEKGMSVSENFTASVRTDRQTSYSFRRQSASGPLKTTRGRNFWQKIRLSGNVSEHGTKYRL